MHVPFVDLKVQYASIRAEIARELEEVLERTAYICGPKVARFEQAFAAAVGARWALGLSSGTEALHVALWALGIGSGDEVIVPVNTYIATSEKLPLVGAQVVFVDHDEASFNIDVAGFEDAITTRTRAVLPVHLYGQPADMDGILRVAASRGLSVVEDCAQAHLATFSGRPVGTFGAVGAFSFFPAKNLGAYGEAGGVVTNDEALYQRMLRFRQHGSVERYEHEIEGHNYRMEEIQGGVLWVKLKYLQQWTESRRTVAARYREWLVDVPDVRAPTELPGRRHVYHLFVIRAQRRDELAAFLKSRGVETGVHYPRPLHLQPAYAHLGIKPGAFPVAERCAPELLSLPMYAELPEDAQQYVVECIREFYGR
jgi:dTDP-4-amino-4,6-dideoxygalactose transaminase